MIVDDCLKYLDRYAGEGRKFDFVFNDLTDIPLSSEKTEVGRDLWLFVKTILNKSFKCLKPDGRYMNHAVGKGKRKSSFFDLFSSLIFSNQTTIILRRLCCSSNGIREGFKRSAFQGEVYTDQQLGTFVLRRMGILSGRTEPGRRSERRRSERASQRKRTGRRAGQRVVIDWPKSDGLQFRS